MSNWYASHISVTIELWIEVFWVISVQFDIRNTLLKLGPSLLGHPVFRNTSNTLSCLSTD
jgi:hypothetical protein